MNRKHHKALSYMAVGALMLGVLGCQQDFVKAPYGGRQDLLPIRGYPNIAVEGSLFETLVFSEPNVEVASPDTPMSVMVPVRSIHDDYGVNIQYQFTFFDDTTRPVSNTGWRFGHLPPRMQRWLEANGLDDKAVQYRLEVRSAR